MGYKKQLFIGGETYINSDLVVSISAANKAGSRRMIDKFTQDGTMVDFSGKGSKRSVILVNSFVQTLFISSVSPDTLRKRLAESNE